MNNKFKLYICISFLAASVSAENNTKSDDVKIEKDRPTDFVNVKNVIPEIQVDMRYYSNHNLVGRKIDGYDEPVCLLTKAAATALKSAETQLLTMGLTLKVWDCYRPQRAVEDFATWAANPKDDIMRKEYYPSVEKKDFFSKKYIAYRSGHTRGSTMDLTIVPLDSKVPPYDPKLKLVSCTAPKSLRSPDNSLDFGTGMDCISPISSPGYQKLSPQIRANRLLFATIMKQAGFTQYPQEWWHFTLANEPYPDKYFDFPVKN